MMPGLWREFTEERTDAAPYRLRNIRSWALTVAALPSQMTDWNILKGLSTSVSIEQFVRTPTWHETIHSMVHRMVHINREMLPDWNWDKLLLRTEDDCLEEFDRVYRSLHNEAGITWRGPVRPQAKESEVSKAEPETATVIVNGEITKTLPVQEKVNGNPMPSGVPSIGSPFVSPFIASQPLSSPFGGTASPFLPPLGNTPDKSRFPLPIVTPLVNHTQGGGFQTQEQERQSAPVTVQTENNSVSNEIYPVLNWSKTQDVTDIPDIPKFERLRIREKIRSVAGMVFLSASPEEFYGDLTGDESMELLRKAGWGNWIPLLFEAATQKANSDVGNISHNVWTSCYALVFSGVSEFAWRSVVCTRNTDNYGRVAPEIADFFKLLKAELEAVYATRPRAEIEALRMENDRALVKTAQFYMKHRADFPFLDGADPYAEDAGTIADLVSKFGLDPLFWAFNREWASDPTSELMNLDPDVLVRFKRLCTERLDGEQNPILSWDAYSTSRISESAYDAVSKYADRLERIDRDRAERERALEEARNAPLVVLHYPDPESVQADPLDGFYRRNAWTDTADTLFDKRMRDKKGRRPPRFKLLRQKALSGRHKFELLLLLAIWGGCGVAASLVGFAGSEEPLALGISLGSAGMSVAALFFTLLF